MFRTMLYVQWRWSRFITLLGAIAGFGVPVLSLRLGIGDGPRPLAVLDAMRDWSVVYPVFAAAVALLMTTAAWGSDHRGRHVYALSLPIPRWRYALLKLGTGAALLAIPVVALWAGALAATWAASIPAGLQGYPTALALRFALATLVAYGVFFAISAGTARTAGIILAVVGGLVATEILAGAAGLDVPVLDMINAYVIHGPGPFAIFSGRWMLIDV
ncbi:MAG: hypothetical protein ACREMJ_11900 [Gemmatimonadales bacterium]